MELENAEVMYQEIQALCKEREFLNSLKALPYGKRIHEGKFRRGNGQPFYSHPLFVAAYLINLGVVHDEAIAISLLHDTMEEDERCTLGDLDVTERIKKGVDILTFRPPSKEKNDAWYNAQLQYMKNIVYSGDAFCNLVKDCDRYHNLTTMPGAFTKEKMLDYTARETKNLFYPNFDVQKELYPEYKNQFILFEIQIKALTNLAEQVWNMPSKKDKKNPVLKLVPKSMSQVVSM